MIDLGEVDFFNKIVTKWFTIQPMVGYCVYYFNFGNDVLRFDVLISVEIIHTSNFKPEKVDKLYLLLTVTYPP